jgi:LysM repeat protein
MNNSNIPTIPTPALPLPKLPLILITLLLLTATSIISTPHLIQASKNHETYTVKPGDTLWQIAQSRGITVETIKKLNGLRSELIRPNQKLTLPKPKTITLTKTTPIAPSGKTIKIITPPPKPNQIAKTNPAIYSLPIYHTPQKPPSPTLPQSPTPSTTLTNPRTIPLDPPSHTAQTRLIRSASENRSQVQLNPQEKEILLAQEPQFDFEQLYNDDIRLPSYSPSPLTNPPPTPPQPPTPSITQKQSTKHTHSTKLRTHLTLKSTEKTHTLPPPPRLHTRLPGRATDHIHAEVRKIAAQKIRYKGSWRPPGETVSWVMDCSNTTRWLYLRVTGIDLGRTASDQYLNLRNRGRLWTVPKDLSGNPSRTFLDKHLRPGDLLFWEHTYRPVRWPPITHVAIYLGKDEKGRYLMAASNSSGTSTRRGGPNIYIFSPEMNFGGYRPIGSSRYRHGRFVAFGRPIDNLDRQTFAQEQLKLHNLYH